MKTDLVDIFEILEQHQGEVETLKNRVDHWKNVVRSILDNDGKMTHTQRKSFERYFNGKGEGRYLAFCGYLDYPRGGERDYVGRFESKEGAIKYARSKHYGKDWLEIYDIELDEWFDFTEALKELFKR